jgi:toxin YoeB
MPVRREAVFDPDFLEDLRWWIRTDRKVALRLLDLVESILRDPFAGIGKPEPVKNFGSDVWSRRLTHEHRVLYQVTAGRINFLQGRYHY